MPDDPRPEPVAMTDDEIEAVSLWYGNQMGRAGTMKK